MNLDLYKKEYRKIVLSEGKKEMKTHIWIFIFSISFLCLFNYIKFPHYFWAQWAILGWGIGLAIHYWGFKNIKEEQDKFEAIAEMNTRKNLNR